MMNYIYPSLMILFSALANAGTSFYCPQNHAYINAGMTQDQVIRACGQPTTRQTADQPVVQQVPVVQLVYSTLNQGPPMDFYPGIAPLYNMWSLPSGSVGINLQVNLINNRVAGISVNQANTNATNVCSGGSFQIGDDISTVYRACGGPNMVNNTYMNKPVPKSQNPQVWIYSFQYQPSITLTFVNGILQSIN